MDGQQSMLVVTHKRRYSELDSNQRESHNIDATWPPLMTTQTPDFGEGLL